MQNYIKKMQALRKSFIKKSSGFVKFSIFVLPLLLLLLTEALQRGNLFEAMQWILHQPLHAVATLLFITALHTSLLMLLNRPYLSILLVSLPCIVCAIISFQKSAIRELPLLPWNTALLKELAISIRLAPELLWLSILIIPVVLLITVTTFYLFGGIKTGFDRKKRLHFLLPSLFLLLSCFFLVPNTLSPHNTLSHQRLDTVSFYQQQGLIFSILSHATQPYMEKPQGYSSEAITSLLKNHPASSNSLLANNSLPDILMVMGEAFSDPTLLTEVSYSKDPVPHLHRLQKQSISGSLLVNAFGGNTTNTEYEALSGMCMSFMSPDTSVYNDFYRMGTPTLPQALRALGYKREAIHAFDGEFLNRSKVYQDIGFEKFVTAKSIQNPKYKGDFVSDEETGNTVIQHYEAHQAKNPQNPYFSFTVTIQNHYNYDLAWYNDQETITVQTPPTMKAQEASMLSGYVQGVHDTDALLGRLTDYLSKQDRPAILVFFGDHLPSIGHHMNIFKKGGLISNESVQTAKNLRKLHTVPFIIWDNFIEKKLSIETISPAYLQSLLLEQYQLPMNSFQSFLASAMKSCPDFGLAAWPQAGAGANPWVELQYRMLQYDLMFGERYALQSILAPTH